MHYFKDAEQRVYGFVHLSSVRDDLIPISESEALTLAAGPAQEVDYPALIAAERYKHEIAGIDFNGTRIDTDDRSKTLITGSAIKALRSADYVLKWKTPAGFIDLPAAGVLLLADAVSDHVQACFDRESVLLQAVADGTFNEQMLQEGWPNEPVSEHSQD